MEMLPTISTTMARPASLSYSAAIPLPSIRCPRTFDGDDQVGEFVLTYLVTVQRT